mgnify:CR=1 FL=1
MEKDILLSISPYIQKYYFNEAYNDLPSSIKEELIAKLSVIAEKVNCIISVGFHLDGEIFIEERHEDPIAYDDIGAALEIKELQIKEAELLKSIKMWYMIYCTTNGQIVREVVVLQNSKKNNQEILEVIEKKYGTDGKEFARQLLSED